ncbi:MAG: hypothetical protein CMC79_05310 [Flavobacteriaceae bacterium]|nr:hypothetical protein [Flavobacteriaceae bacterium]|tara:strand:+ start:965 stop:1585 length:621 start_codon:yes stop_codon:yes gene_type:complete
MKLVELKIKGISYTESESGAYALILSELEGKRKLPVIIGGYEAQAIAIALEKEISPSRPLTHDLFKNFANIFDIYLKKVIIHKLVDGVFFANLICEKDKIEEIIDSRTSDAIAMALRFNAPIFIHESILKIAGFSASIKSEKKQKLADENWVKKFFSETPKGSLPEKLEKLSISELKKILKKLVSSEDYENAARIRDLISKKENKG